MAFYFSPFPVVSYDPTGQNRPTLAVDITRRFKLSSLTNNAALVYYEYEIKETDRPDIMAHKYYENPKLDWVFFITNQIHDPYFQWPLTTEQFHNYIQAKYGSIANAQNQIHHYEWTVTQRKEYVTNDDEIINIPERVLRVDETTYNTLAASEKRIVTYYEHEEKLNEKNRNIKIMSKDFIPELMQSFQDVFK
jgi:hypothetical protein